MKKSFLAGTLAVVILAAVLAAGCTTNPTTTSPTSTPSASTTTTTTSATEDQAIIQYLGTSMQRLNFTVDTPFSLQPGPQLGIAAYNATVSDRNGTAYVVSVQACDNAATSQAHFIALRDMLIGQGYATVQQNATRWLGFNANTQRGAAVEHGTSELMPFYCMVLTGGRPVAPVTSGARPYSSTMWQNTWNNMHGYGGNGYGMGPYMGQGMNANTRTQMQNEMQEHMGGGR